MRILLLNQCFHPDHVSSAQQLTDLAAGLVAAGHEVTAVAASRGYDNPDRRYPVDETWNGVRIRRIWTPGLGKKAKWRRLVDFAVFWLNATLILLRQPRSDVTVCLASPPRGPHRGAGPRHGGAPGSQRRARRAHSCGCALVARPRG